MPPVEKEVGRGEPSSGGHTPGPWYVAGKDEGPARHHLAIGAKGSLMVLASMNEVHTHTPANARLIATAPDGYALADLVIRVCHVEELSEGTEVTISAPDAARLLNAAARLISKSQGAS